MATIAKPFTINDFHKRSARHFLVVETTLPDDKCRQVLALSNRIRLAGNQLAMEMEKRNQQLFRTREYRQLLEQVKSARGDDKTKITARLDQMRTDFGLTEEDCRKYMKYLSKHFNFLNDFGVAKYKDIWKGVKACLFAKGKHIKVKKYGIYPAIRAKEITRGIPICLKKGKLQFKLGKDMLIDLKITDRFIQDEVDAVLNYCRNASAIDKMALEQYIATGECMNTYRPCFASLVPKIIRGKIRVYLHLCIEGKALPKYTKDGQLRHKLGTGRVSCDIGTQSIAMVSENEVMLENIAVRGSKDLVKEKAALTRINLRAMDRSLRANNPKNYNPNGTVKSGPKKWHRSKNYRKKCYQFANYSRKAAVSRRLAHNQMANNLRSLGDEFITEPKNAARLAVRAKKTTVNKKGKFNCKKRFGKSILNRCPGYLQSKIEHTFTETGGRYFEVSNDYRASQYDHTSDKYVKKKLSQRQYKLSDGTLVQRDWYSAFLLFCCDIQTIVSKKDPNKQKMVFSIDRDKCHRLFRKFYKRENAMVALIKSLHLKIFNSGL